MVRLREKTEELELSVERCWCGVQHAVPQSLVDLQRRQFQDGVTQQDIYCPLGHAWILSGPSKSERLERLLTRERAQHDQTRADRDRIEARRRAEKAAKTRLKNRVAKGVCPCCKRSFANLARHMACKHPEVVACENEQ